jgi:hypothetical protein
MPRSVTVVALAAALCCAANALAQEATVELQRYERWQLHPAPGAPSQDTTALLLLFVRNPSNALVKRWQAILVARDSLGAELFRLALERDSADLEPGEMVRLELQFHDTPSRDDEYDHLLLNDTTNLRLTFDEVRVVSQAEVVYVPRGAMLCFDRAAFEELAAVRAADSTAWRDAGTRLGCHLAQADLAVEYLGEAAPGGTVVRIKRMERVAWVFSGGLRRP